MAQMDVMNDFLKANFLKTSEAEKVVENILNEEVKLGNLVSYEMKADADIIGDLGGYLHFLVKYLRKHETNARERCLFLKTMPFRNMQMRDFVEKSGIFKKESAIYTRLLNKIRKFSTNIWCGYCYYHKSDLFIMDGFKELGYEPVEDVLKCLSKPEVKAILKGLASMHASSLAYEERNHRKIGTVLKDVLNEAIVTPNGAWYNTGIRAIMEVTRKSASYSAEPLQNFLKERVPPILESIYKMVNPSKEYCNVLCHREVWAGNVFFAKSEPYEKGAVFVDFQFSRYSPAAIDVLMALYLNIRPSERKPIEEECYKYYYEQFAHEMAHMRLNAERFITYENFMKSIKEMAVFGAVYNCIFATAAKAPRAFMNDMKANRQDDYNRYMNVDRTEAVEELMKTDPEFNSYLLECIDDMMKIMTTSY